MEQITDIGKQQYVNPEDRDTYKNILETKGLIRGFEVQLINKNGKPIWVSITSRAVKDDTGKVLRYEGNVVDITGRKETEKALKQSESNLSNIINFLPDATFAINLEGEIILWNKAIEKMTGFSAESMLGKRDHEYSLPFYGERRPVLLNFLFSWNKNIENQYSFIYKEGNTLFTETEAVSSCGQTRTIWAKASPLFDDQGKIIGAIESVRDITDHKETENALRKERDFSSNLVESSPAFFVAINGDGTTRMMNKSMLNTLGYTLEEIVGKDYLTTFTAETDRKLLAVVFSRLVSQSQSTINENRVLTKDGRELLVEWHGRAIVKPGGGLDYFFGVGIDITERKQVEESLKESETRYRSLFENAVEGVYKTTPEGRFIYANPAQAKLFGYDSPQELMEQITNIARQHYANPEDRKIYKNTLAAEGVIKGFEVKLLKKDGSPVWASLNARAIKDDTGTVINHEGTVVDITDRKRSEEALKISRNNLQAIFDSVQDGIFIHDIEGKIIDVNAKMLAMYQVNHAQALSFSIVKDYSSPDNPLDQLPAMWEKVVNGESASFEWIARRPINGSIFPARVFMTRITMADEDAVLASITDVTKQKRLEGLLIQAQKLEAVGTLAGGLAHDFNNLLMGIQGYASLMMLELNRGNPHYERLKHIEEQVRSAADLTRQLLGFARGGRYEMRPVNINEIIKKTSMMFSRTKKELTIHGKYGQDLWAVEADQGQIEQVLLNLYVNAWHAMPSGGELYLETGNLTLNKSYTAPYDTPPGNYVKISVTDTGKGMDEKTMKRIFDPFFTTKEMGRGTGLGLAMVYGIIKGHNGFINVYSEPGHGTTFTLYLPASEKEAFVEKPFIPEVLSGSETILIVDDEPIVLTVSKEILESLGYTVHGINSGEKAINFYKEMKDTIDLIILDMIMPGLSGSEAFDRIRKFDPSAKILLSSGYSLNGQAKKILAKGCHGFIQKPFDIAQISRKIREILEGPID